ncbi:MAG TPA: aromatic acid decarboxylase [Lachnospiraceae bacterium]|nr:aromatic acid decarboxylase [Lachnospiraceae bacterium]
MSKRIIVGVTGASGIDVAREVLELIADTDGFESHLVMSDSAKRTAELECTYGPDALEKAADVVYPNDRIESRIASGTFRTEGMVIVPCSMKTVAGIAGGFSDSLLLRAADVVLKERRKLVLAVRETPFNGIHLRNMKELWEMGADIMPLMMTFYNRPETIEDMVHHMACKCVERLGIEPKCFKRW